MSTPAVSDLIVTAINTVVCQSLTSQFSVSAYKQWWHVRRSAHFLLVTTSQVCSPSCTETFLGCFECLARARIRNHESCMIRLECAFSPWTDRFHCLRRSLGFSPRLWSLPIRRNPSFVHVRAWKLRRNWLQVVAWRSFLVHSLASWTSLPATRQTATQSCWRPWGRHAGMCCAVREQWQCQRGHLQVRVWLSLYSDMAWRGMACGRPQLCGICRLVLAPAYLVAALQTLQCRGNLVWPAVLNFLSSISPHCHPVESDFHQRKNVGAVQVSSCSPSSYPVTNEVSLPAHGMLRPPLSFAPSCYVISCHVSRSQVAVPAGRQTAVQQLVHRCKAWGPPVARALPGWAIAVAVIPLCTCAFSSSRWFKGSGCIIHLTLSLAGWC